MKNKVILISIDGMRPVNGIGELLAAAGNGKESSCHKMTGKTMKNVMRAVKICENRIRRLAVFSGQEYPKYKKHLRV